MIARRFGLAVGFVGLFATIGCWSDDGLDQRYPVTGTVTYKGKPLEKGLITFAPEKPDQGRGAGGTIKDGSYTLTTNMPDDGAFPGKYEVMIADVAVDMNIALAETEKAAAKGGSKAMPGMVDPAMIAKVSKKAKNNVPTKYSKAASSTLKAEVKAENMNKFDFQLTD